MEIDDRWEEFHTGADGYWGDAFAYSHTRNGKKQADVMMIMITMPEEVFFEDMKRSMNTLFEGLQPVQSPGKQKPAKKHHRLER